MAVALPVGVSPILTRMYTPNDFGIFGVYTSITLILLSISTGKYEQAIVLPKNERDAAELVIITTVIALFFAVILSIVIAIWHSEIVDVLDLNDIGYWLYFLPMSVFLSGVYQALNYWNIRKKYFKNISKNRVINSVTTVAGNFSIFTILTGPAGLVLGELIGRLLVTWRFVQDYVISNNHVLKSIRPLRLLALVKRYQKYVFYVTPAAILNVGSKQLPVLIFSTFYSASFVGFLALAQRVIQAPIGIIASAFSETLLQKMSVELRERGECQQLFDKTFIILASCSFFPFVIFFHFSEDFFEFVFGVTWRPAGLIVKILIPFYYVYLISGVLNIIFIAGEKNKQNLTFQIILFISTVGTTWLSTHLGISATDALIIFSSANSIAFLVGLVFSYRISRGFA